MTKQANSPVVPSTTSSKRLSTRFSHGLHSSLKACWPVHGSNSQPLLHRAFVHVSATRSTRTECEASCSAKHGRKDKAQTHRIHPTTTKQRIKAADCAKSNVKDLQYYNTPEYYNIAPLFSAVPPRYSCLRPQLRAVLSQPRSNPVAAATVTVNHRRSNPISAAAVAGQG